MKSPCLSSTEQLLLAGCSVIESTAAVSVYLRF